MTRSAPDHLTPFAYFGGYLATDLVEVADLAANPGALEHGWWAVCATFEGAITGYRFAHVTVEPMSAARAPWPGIDVPWRTSMDRAEYVRGVGEIRRRIARGDVYQVNLCRLLTADLEASEAELNDELGSARADEYDPLALAHILADGNPAQYQGVLDTGIEWIVTASPELFLQRDGDELISSPIKGTAPPGELFAAKDTPENVMICDLVRNDLGKVATTGSVQVTKLLSREELPGLAHLVSTVRVQVRSEAGWREVLAATLPPGSVSGAPKHTALQAISDLESVSRGPYCGAIGYVDGDRSVASLAVGIRTFFTSHGRRQLNFGTGAGITYLSDAEAEWAETELKAARLIALASEPNC
ncbi:MAG: chorismate-binding protein [Nakamurella sp.]